MYPHSSAPVLHCRFQAVPANYVKLTLNCFDSLVCEEDCVALPCQVDADVIFGLGQMRGEEFYGDLGESRIRVGCVHVA
jgi:hypothetical protein